MDDVARGMVELDGDVLDHLRNHSSGPLSSSVPVNPSTPPLVPSPRSSGALSFEEGPQNTEITSPASASSNATGPPYWTAGPGAVGDGVKRRDDRERHGRDRAAHQDHGRQPG
jgi:hypothetical protein